jgi:hypothetical protein
MIMIMAPRGTKSTKYMCKEKFLNVMNVTVSNNSPHDFLFVFGGAKEISVYCGFSEELKKSKWIIRVE